MTVNLGRTLFSQIMDFVPWTSFERIVARYGGDVRVRRLRCGEQFRIMAFAQMTYRESLRDIEACLGAQPSKLYGMGLAGERGHDNGLQVSRVDADAFARLLQLAVEHSELPRQPFEALLLLVRHLAPRASCRDTPPSSASISRASAGAAWRAIPPATSFWWMRSPSTWPADPSWLRIVSVFRTSAARTWSSARWA